MAGVEQVTAFVTSKGEYFRRQIDAAEQEAIDKLMDKLQTSLYQDHIVTILQAVRSYPQEFYELASAHYVVDIANKTTFPDEEPTVIEET